MKLVYSICYYYTVNETANISKHIKQFEKISQELKWSKFVVVAMVDSKEESLQEQVKKELEEFIHKESPSIESDVLVSYNWGGTILGLWMVYNFVKDYRTHYALSLGGSTFIAHFEEDFFPLGDWFWESRIRLTDGNVFIGEVTGGRVRRSDRYVDSIGRGAPGSGEHTSLGDPEVWTDGGFYFSDLTRLKKAEEHIGIFHKGDPDIKYEKGKDGIDKGEVGFPTLLYHAGLCFDAVNRKDFFSYNYDQYRFFRIISAESFTESGSLQGELASQSVLAPPLRSPMAVVTAMKNIIKNKVVCELGCAYGDLLSQFLRYAEEAKGIEPDSNRFAICEQRYSKNSLVNVTKGDWMKDPIPEADVYYIWPEHTEQAGPLIDLLMNKKDFKGVIVLGGDSSNEHVDEVANIKKQSDNWGGELITFPFTEGEGYRQKGEFVLAVIDKRKGSSQICNENKKKNLVIILSHCDTPVKLKILEENINSLRSIDVDILLTSHIPIDLELQNMVDYFIFDKSNPLIPRARKVLHRWGVRNAENINKKIKLVQPIRDHWGGVMNQIIKAADFSLRLDYDCYSFIGYDVGLEDYHLRELDNPCPTEDIVTCSWGSSWFETKNFRNFSEYHENDKDMKIASFRGKFAGCDFNIMKKDCFQKIVDLFSMNKYLEKDENGFLFEVAEEYWTSLVYLFKVRFLKDIEEKIQLADLDQNHLNDLFKLFISKGKNRNVLFHEIKEPVKFRINNEKIIEIKNNHLETGVKQIEYLTKDAPYSFSKEMEKSDREEYIVTVLDD